MNGGARAAFEPHQARLHLGGVDGGGALSHQAFHALAHADFL